MYNRSTHSYLVRQRMAVHVTENPALNSVAANVKPKCTRLISRVEHWNAST